jgi:nitrogen fixation NifU-like protein
MDIYAQNILDRYKEPFYKDKKVKPDIRGKQVNPSCGDRLEIKLELSGDLNDPNSLIKAYTFTGVGCAISQAAADILGDLIVGKTVDEVANMKKDDLLVALGIEISERRMNCALLALNALQGAINKSDHD